MIYSSVIATVCTYLFAYFNPTPPTLFELYVVMFVVFIAGLLNELLRELKEINGK